MASSSGQISEPYKKHLMNIKMYCHVKTKSGDVTTNTQKSVDVKDITTFMNWMCSRRQTDGFAPSTVITAASCVNLKVSRLRQKLCG